MGERSGRRSARVGLAMVLFLALPALGALGLPDLRLSDPSIDPTAVDQGDPAVVSATVSSSGIVEADEVAIRIAWRRVDLHEECGFAERTASPQEIRRGYLIEEPIDTSSLVAGTYSITITVDPGNLIPEEDETNNQATLLLDVRALKPELHPQKLVLNPASPVERGEAVAVTAEIENSGDHVAGGFTVQFFLFPAFCVTEEMAIYRVSATIAGDEQRGEWSFEELASSADFNTEAWFAEVGDELDDRMWIPFWSVHVPGLDMDDTIELTGVLPTGMGLLDMLVEEATQEEPRPMIPGSIMRALNPRSDEPDNPRDESEIELLKRAETIYAISVVVDPEGSEDLRVLEEDEKNNRITGVLTICSSTLALADLQIERLYLDGPLPLEWEDRQDVTVVVANTGGVAAPSDRDDDTARVEIEISYRRVGAGSSEWKSLGTQEIADIDDRLGIEEENDKVENDDVEIDVEDLSLAPGQYELRATVDPDNQIAEQNEGNNELVIGFSVEGAELHPTGILVGSSVVRQGDTISVTAPIRNTGERTLESFVVGFFLDDLRFDTYYYYEPAIDRDDGLEERDVAQARGLLETADLAPGEYELRVVVDPDDAIPEMDEHNNAISRTLTILPREPRKAELVPIAIALVPDSPLPAAQDVDVELTVWNRGTLDASGFLVGLELRSEKSQTWTRIDDPEARVLVSGLPRGGRETLRLRLSHRHITLEGPYALRTVVDVADQIEELDEANNLLATAFWVGPPEAPPPPPTPQPNLVIEDMSVTPSTDLDALQLLQTRVTIANTGLRDAEASTVSLYWVDGSGARTPAGQHAVPELAAGASVVLEDSTIAAPALAGVYRLCGQADSHYEIEEQSELDNERCVLVGVTGSVKPDISVTEVRFSADQPFEKDVQVRVFATVKNVGVVAAGPFRVRFAQHDEGPRADAPVAGLGPGESITLAFNVSTSSVGDFVLSVIADVDDTVTESDDDAQTNNNTAEAPFTVVPVASVSVEELATLGAQVRHLAVDQASDVLYAASLDGRIVAFRHGRPPTMLFDVTVQGPVSVVALSPGAALYVVTGIGVVCVLDPETGETREEIALPESVTVSSIAISGGGAVYFGTNVGVLMLEAQGGVVTGDASVGQVFAMALDSATGYVYAMADSALYVFDAYLEQKCSITDYSANPTSIAVGHDGVYLGTEDGVLIAYAACDGNDLAEMWRHPQAGVLGSAIAAVVVDPRDFDPIYVAVEEGMLAALDYAGNELWTYFGSPDSPLATVESAPAWDARTGRVFIVDALGIPHVLTASGLEALVIDAGLSAGVHVQSALIIDEYTLGTGGGARLLRAYYFGGDNGTVYMIQTER